MDVTVLKELLNGRWAAERRECLNIISDEKFATQYGLTVSEQREKVLQQLHGLKEAGVVTKAFPTGFGGEGNFGGHVVCFEELVTVNPSLQIKAGVQYGLFAAAIQHLGTKKHHDRFLQDAVDLKILGSYGMTESGHGSDVFNIETTATFDAEKDGFIIHSPTRSAWKDYLGNAAQHSSWAVIFAQLYIENVCYGVHGFMVQLRNPDGTLCEGVYIEDNGVKGGLNGVDNGRVCFTDVFIPRDNMLDRYGSVSKYGVYSSKIVNPNRRFFAMLGTLVQGRVSLDGAAVAASKLSLQLAVQYANRRKQFKNSEGVENFLMSYPSHQKRLIPLVAETYAAAFAHENLLQMFDQIFSKLVDSDGEEVEGMENLETFAAAMKSSNTWHTLNVLQQTREACGGNGFLIENSIVGLKNDFDVYVTFEGDNTVLTQLVGKRVVKDKQKELTSMTKMGQILYMLKLKTCTPRLTKNLPHVQKTLQNMLNLLSTEIVSNISAALKQGKTMDDVLSSNQNNIILLGKLYAEYVKFESFIKTAKYVNSRKEWEPFRDLQLLYGYMVFQKMVDGFSQFNFFTTSKVKQINSTVSQLTENLAEHAEFFVNVFDYVPKISNPPMLTQQ